MQSTIVVVPCYNEQRRLDLAALASTLEQLPWLRFVFVDDGSSDGTGEMLGDFTKSWPGRAFARRLAHNSGKAEAVRQGVEYAMSMDAELVGYWDADLSTPLGAIPKFVECFRRESTMLVLGSRVRSLGRRIERSAVRHYIGRVFATLAARALDLHVYDTQCGAKMFRVSAPMQRIFSRPFELNWAFDVEILARLAGEAKSGDFQVEDVCTELVLDSWIEPGGSKLGLKQVPKVFMEIARLNRVVKRERGANRR
jgi:glycosyltransferase involved in cell wall biosynthesis